MDLYACIGGREKRKYRVALALAIGANPAYLWQIATGRRRASPNLAKRIEIATGGQVKKESLRPDVWGKPRRARKKSHENLEPKVKAL